MPNQAISPQLPPNTPLDAIPSKALVNVGRTTKQSLTDWKPKAKQVRFRDAVYRREIETILADAEGPGAPTTKTSEQKRQIIAVATRKPEDEGVPVTDFCHELLAQTVGDLGIVKTISTAQIGRFLKERSITTTPKSVLGTSQH
jgi:hypothetical protein